MRLILWIVVCTSLALLSACAQTVAGTASNAGPPSGAPPSPTSGSSASSDLPDPTTVQEETAEETTGNDGSSSPSGTGRDVSTINGRVTVRDTGEPYPGVSVEFKNLYGENVHTETDANGEYSLPVPADVYTALAVDLDNLNAGFDVVGRSSTVSVPPSTQVDFEGYPIVEGYQPVP
jgi:hypothetical protein